MNRNLRKNYISEIIKALHVLNGTEFEQFGYIILQDITDMELIHRGQNTSGSPVGYTVDSYSDDVHLVGEYGTNDNYYSSLEKFKSDINHAINLSSSVKSIYVFSNRECPPSVAIEATKICADYKQNNKIQIKWYDARRIAEYIVDKMLHKDITKDNLSNYLPVLDRIYNENLLNNALPSPGNNYACNTIKELEIRNLIEKHQYVLIHGISGIGKTLISLSIANAIRDTFDLTIFLNGADISSFHDLNSLKISRAGFSQNIIGLIKRQKTLIVIDDLQNDVINIIKTLIDNSMNGTCIIVTSQINKNTLTSNIELNFPPEPMCKQILEYDIDEDNYCPTITFNRIMLKTSGHPLLLTLINRMIIEDGLTWKEIEEELRFIPNFIDDKGITFSNRIIARHIASVKQELGVIKWIESKFIEKTLLKDLIGLQGIKKLQSRSLINVITSDIIKIHDIIYSSINSVYNENIDFSDRFFDFFKSNVSDKNALFFRALYTHREKIISCFEKNLLPGVELYLYLLSTPDDEKNIINRIDYNYLLIPSFTYDKQLYFDILSVIELYECKYRIICKNNRASSQEYIEKVINETKILLNTHNLSNNIRLDILHHLGKFSRFADDIPSAITYFNQVIDSNPNAFESKLQLARLLLNSDISRSIQYLCDILDAYVSESTVVSTTVVLAAYEELRKKQYKHLKDKYIFQNYSKFENAILSPAIYQFDQPFRVLSGLAKDLSFNNPELLISLVNAMPIPSINEIDVKTAFSVGELYKEVGKSYMWSNLDYHNIRYYFEQADAFYSKSIQFDHYSKRMIAENYILMEDGKKATDLLDQISEEKKDLFWFYRYSQGLRLQSKFDKALLNINLAFNMIDDKTKSYKSTLHHEKGKILYQMSDSNWINQFTLAISESKNDKYTAKLNDELNKNLSYK